MSEARLLFVDGSDLGLRVRLDGESILIERELCCRQRIPLQRVGRIVVRKPRHDLLEFCLAVLSAGIVIHFQDGTGKLTGYLRPAATPDAWMWRELAALIHDYASADPIHRWARQIHDHAVSRFFAVRLKQASGLTLQRRLERYVRLACKTSRLEAEFEELDELLLAWLEAKLFSLGLQPVSCAVGQFNLEFSGLLLAPLRIKLLWAFATWRRCQGERVLRPQLMAFVELQGRLLLLPALSAQLESLWTQYEDPWIFAQAADRRLGDRRPGADLD